jgi:hypothetical protein
MGLGLSDEWTLGFGLEWRRGRFIWGIIVPQRLKRKVSHNV